MLTRLPNLQPSGRVTIENMSVSYADAVAVKDCNLDIAPGTFVCLLGPSGCGKTTTLRVVAGLSKTTTGTVCFDGRDVTNLPPHRRNVAMVFQDLALFPHMTVFENVAFGLRVRKLASDQIKHKVLPILEMLQLSGLQHRLPSQLSGGQQQRVAIARSLAVEPTVLLLDEPFAALDRKLREDLRIELRNIQRRMGITVLFVTHDQEEALTMADSIVVMNAGRIEQQGSAADVYERPQTRFVLRFVGFSNFLKLVEADPASGTFCAAATKIKVGGHSIVEDGELQLAIRAERLRVELSDQFLDDENCLAAIVSDVTYEGASILYELKLSDGQRLFARHPNIGDRQGRNRHSIDQPVFVGWKIDDAVLLSPRSSMDHHGA